MDWSVKAAIEIDETLGNAVIKNTKIDAGFFCGVSIHDIASIIQKYYNKEYNKSLNRNCSADASQSG